MTKFIVHSPQDFPGIRQYISPAQPPSRSIMLAGILADAIRYDSQVEAEVARGRMSSLYGLVISQVAE